MNSLILLFSVLCVIPGLVQHVSAAEDENGAFSRWSFSCVSLCVSISLSLSLTPRNTKSINNVTVEAI